MKFIPHPSPVDIAFMNGGDLISSSVVTTNTASFTPDIII